MKIKKLDKIILGSNLYNKHKQIFNSILFPESAKNNYWGISHGPNLQLIEGEDELYMQSLYLKVKSLQSAKEFIEKENLG